MSAPQASFRDPSGYLFEREGRLLRVVLPDGEENARLWLESKALDRFREKGRLVRTRVLSPTEVSDLGLTHARLVLEHERIPFVSYPSEWTPAMLAAAGELTLDLAEALLPEGLGIKDATPFNVLFRGPEPVFVDALSFERRAPKDPLWRPLAQFERTFVYPLLAATQLGITLRQTLGVHREGVEPEDMVRWAGPLRKWLPPFLTQATLPAWLGQRNSVETPEFYRARESSTAEQAQFILGQRLKSARKVLRKVGPKTSQRSIWSEYQGGECHYAEQDRNLKRRLVDDALGASTSGRAVLDIGANQGEYSRLATARGHRVVAIDLDSVTMDNLWRQVRTSGESVLPLVVDLSAPTPGKGWSNREEKSFLDRARGQFDMVLMLAVVHHLLVTHRIPLEEIVELASSLSRQSLIVEFVGPQDPLFRRLCRGRENLHSDFSSQRFEEAFRARFPYIRQKQDLSNGRVLYEMAKEIP